MRARESERERERDRQTDRQTERERQRERERESKRAQREGGELRKSSELSLSKVSEMVRGGQGGVAEEHRGPAADGPLIVSMHCVFISSKEEPAKHKE